MPRIVALLFGAALVAGCASAPEGLPDTGNPALHAVDDERLRELMGEMNNLVFERMRTELDIDRERRRKALKIAEVAGNMAQTVGAIIDTLPGLGLSPNEQTTFLTLADKLRSRVRTLEEQANRNYIDAIPGTLEQIETTCTGCHQLFRKTK
jgi:hypothetical protein